MIQMRNFVRDTQGSTITVVAVALFMILGVASLSIDALYLYVLKDRLQTTADVAALAAVQDIEDQDEAKATAIEYATKNMDTDAHGEVLSLGDVVIGGWDPDTRIFTPNADPANAVRVTTRREQVNNNPAGLFFARVLGIDEVDLSAQATAAFEPRKVELAMVLDNSGSMDMFGGSMQYLIDAADQLLDMMFQGESTLDESRISIVPFRALVHLGTGHADWLSGAAPGTWNGCFLARFEPVGGGPYRLTDSPPADVPFDPAPDTTTSNRNCSVQMVATEDDRDVLDTAMNALGAQYQTDMYEAMAWAWRALSPRWRGVWSDPDFPKDYDDEWRKIAIIVTDGWSSSWMSPYNNSTHDQLIPNVCEDMKAEEIEIYVIWMDKNNNAKVAARPYYEQCASDGGHHFADAQSQADVDAAFSEIARRILELRLVN
jgi:hypothetical protein